MAPASTPPGKLVVILGAGASHGARFPSPPLGKDLLDYLDRYLQLTEKHASSNPHGLPFRKNRQLERLRLLVNRAKEHRWTYEQLVDHEVAKHDPYNEYLGLLNRLLVVAFILPATPWNPPIPRVDEAFDKGPDTYDGLLYSLSQRGYHPSNLIFVTLNYDLLLEQAIERTGEMYDYLLPGYTRNGGYHLLKIHGSTNWWGDLGPLGPLKEKEPIPSPVMLTSRGPTYKSIRVEQDPYEACLYDGAGDPILAHYCIGKPIFINDVTVAEIRSSAIAECRAATQALIIGVHSPRSADEDETLWKMFMALKTGEVPTQYVGLPPDTRITEAIFHFEPISKTFNDFLRSS